MKTNEKNTSATIIYASFHHLNTKKIADEIGNVLKTVPKNFFEVEEGDIKNADIIGIGSGIYMAKFYQGLTRKIAEIKSLENKEVFLFSTSGVKENIVLNRGHKDIKKILKKKNVRIIGEFSCLGYDTYGPLKLFGGVNKGRPSKDDIEKARAFAENILQKP